MEEVVDAAYREFCFGTGCIFQGWSWSDLSKELEKVGVDPYMCSIRAAVIDGLRMQFL